MLNAYPEVVRDTIKSLVEEIWIAQFGSRNLHRAVWIAQFASRNSRCGFASRSMA